MNKEELEAKLKDVQSKIATHRAKILTSQAAIAKLELEEKLLQKHIAHLPTPSPPEVPSS